MSYFQYITGISTIIGVILQFFDYFPEHKKLRAWMTTFLFGCFIGSFSSVLINSNINFDISITSYTLLLIFLITVTMLSLIISLLTKEYDKREPLYVIAIVFGIVFLMVLFIGTAIRHNSETESIKNEKSRLTNSELIQLSELAIEKSDYDRALMHINVVRERFSDNDEWLIILDEKVNQIKSQQLQLNNDIFNN